MNREIINPAAAARGRVRAYQVYTHGFNPAKAVTKVRGGHIIPGRWRGMIGWQHNDVLYDWASIVSRLMTTGASEYRIAGMYLEYKNVASVGDAVTVPAFNRSGGIAYYDALSGSPDVDYLRVPLVAATRSSTDEVLFPDGNLATFFAMSQGTVGVHGKAFNSGSNSKVYGGALVAIPDQGDRTQDLVFSRFYFEAAEQQVKLSTSEIGLEWEIELE